jgi:Fe2+ or Zn2+ uptake regulation protein
MNISKRKSLQRSVILSIVKRSHSHPRAEDVYSEAKLIIPSLSLGTVYRNLRLLVSQGEIREVLLAGNSTRFDGMTEEHEHFVCNNCGHITDLRLSAPPPSALSLENQLPGAEISSYKLTFYGLCSDCSKLR